jgi:multidrug resistance efflux pump
MPAGVALSSARLVKKSRPLPVWVAQAAVGLATAAFSFWWKMERFLLSTASSLK